MKSQVRNESRILGIDPSAKGFGFAVLEGREILVDWGTKEVSGNKNQSCLEEIEELLKLYRPHLIIVEDCQSRGSRRSRRVKELISQIGRTAKEWGIQVRRVSRLAVKRVFAAWNAFNKHEIARVIAQQFVELALRLPPRRRSWMSEDQRYSIFDAVALILAYLERRSKHTQKP